MVEVLTYLRKWRGGGGERVGEGEVLIGGWREEVGAKVIVGVYVAEPRPWARPMLTEPTALPFVGRKDWSVPCPVREGRRMCSRQTPRESVLNSLSQVAASFSFPGLWISCAHHLLNTCHPVRPKKKPGDTFAMRLPSSSPESGSCLLTPMWRVRSTEHAWQSLGVLGLRHIRPPGLILHFEPSPQYRIGRVHCPSRVGENQSVRARPSPSGRIVGAPCRPTNEFLRRADAYAAS